MSATIQEQAIHGREYPQPHVKTIAILIADDHVLIREGVKKILKGAPDMKITAEAENSEQTLEHLRKAHFDLVLLDLSFPGRSGLELLKDLKREYPKLPVLILTMHPEGRFATRTLMEGASGYLTKDCAAEELITAIRSVVNGKKYISVSLSERLAAGLETDAGLHELLSNREYQVFCMIALGKTARALADELSLSVNTVNTYRSRILGKMKMTKNAELIRYALQKHLVD